MRIEYSDHAERKIKQRNLKKNHIRKTLINSEYIFKSYGNRKIAYKKIGKLYLAVVFIKENNNTIVITAHWEKRFRPKK